MNLKDFLTPHNVRQFHIDLTVETTCTKQSLVENVGTVGGGQHNDTRIGAKAIHFSKQLVQCAFALVVAACESIFATGATDGVNLIDEDDARSLRLGIVKQIADARSTHTDKHLNEIGTRKAEERHIGLTRYALGQQGLTRSRRANKQHALGNLAAQFGVFLRILQEINHFHNLHLGFFQARHILESDIDIGVFVVELRPRFSNVENRAGTAAHAAPHATNQHDIEHGEQGQRNHPFQDAAHPIATPYIADIHRVRNILLGVLHHFLKTVERTYFIGVVRSEGESVRIGLRVREFAPQALPIQVDFGILTIDEFNLAHLLLLQKFDELALVDFLCRGDSIPAKKLHTDQHGEQNGINPHQIEPPFAIRSLVGLVRLVGLRRLARVVASLLSLFILHL